METGKHWKKLVRGVVALLLALDVILIGVIWRAARTAPEDQKTERDRLRAEVNLLKADVERGNTIKAHLADVDSRSAQFYKDQFSNASTGYSELIIDLGTIAAHSGVKTSLVSFHQNELKGRGVTEVRITAGVEGDYQGLIQFINGLERSKNFYLLDDLSLASASTGAIRLNLALRAYFRS